MKQKERSLVEHTKHAEGNYGGFSFGGCQPDGVKVHKPLRKGIEFPNGATSALLLTFDVEGNYGNGTGNEELEIANYDRICGRLETNEIPATFNIVGKMIEERGPGFVQRMLDSGSEIAPHGYVHELNKRHGGEKVYAGHYGAVENSMQVNDGIQVIEKKFPDTVKGYRLPYGHFNEYSYDALEAAGLQWSSHVGIDDFMHPENGYGTQPFQMGLGDKIYDLIEIPLDSQTFDWPIWMADETSNPSFVEAVRAYCQRRNIPFNRTPEGGVAVWRQRMLEAIENKSVFTLLCHPINLAVKNGAWEDPLEQFLFPVIDLLGELNRTKKAWVCTCGQMSAFYRQVS
ncbi:MAG: polysaccharide deacetylase family protein [Bacteroidota bacterium]